MLHVDKCHLMIRPRGTILIWDIYMASYYNSSYIATYCNQLCYVCMYKALHTLVNQLHMYVALYV